LGESASQALLFSVQNNLNLESREALVQNPSKLLEGLRSLLGQKGFSYIEPRVIEEIKASFEIEKNRKLDLQEVLQESREIYLSRR